METHYCSNCGSVCAYDGRCGDGPYLACQCGSSANSQWIDDGRGGYTVYLNDAHPVRASEFAPKKQLEKVEQTPPRHYENWSREDD
jgi:hypothetical protein